MKYRILEIRKFYQELNIDMFNSKTKKAEREAAKKEFSNEEALKTFLLENCGNTHFDKWAWVNSHRIKWDNVLKSLIDIDTVSINDINTVSNIGYNKASYEKLEKEKAKARRNYNACAQWLNNNPRLLEKFVMR